MEKIKKIGGYKLSADKKKEMKALLSEVVVIEEDMKVLKELGTNTEATDKLIKTGKESLKILLDRFG